MNRAGVLDDDENLWPHHLVLWAAVLEAAATDGYRLARAARPDLDAGAVLVDLIDGLPADTGAEVAQRWPTLSAAGTGEVTAVLEFLRDRARDLRALAVDMTASSVGAR